MTDATTPEQPRTAADPSECPICGDWRDSPTADCANCGWAIRPCGDALGLCAYAGRHEGPHKIAGSWKQRLAIEAQARPVASEGLRAALAETIEWITTYDDAMGHGYCAMQNEDAYLESCTCGYDQKLAGWRAALASDAGSVGALDVDALDRAMAAAGVHVDAARPGPHRPVGCESCQKGIAAIAAAYDAERQGES